MRKSMQERKQNAKIRKNAQNANSDFKYVYFTAFTRLLKGEVIKQGKGNRECHRAFWQRS